MGGLGGQDKERLKNSTPHIVVGTPGRIRDLVEGKDLKRRLNNTASKVIVFYGFRLVLQGTGNKYVFMINEQVLIYCITFRYWSMFEFWFHDFLVICKEFSILCNIILNI